ncbi:methionyl-tRNA formyltransferase [Saprospira sp. CCB-QB6]|uniref:methionyl-tRNA formyltransferase n=1 Tax=Saprospira sp. CCB-QB6 TaxID=3023936 RepID=UPI002349F8D2|nr:methionyl-tRNA formyltransferase [Saprospira sp. CCB-QB6]WCL80934.1 methionyl-tRNA formyltransferase [Saprospira sp. CCB-QB6]
MRIIFMGTPDFAVPSLQALVEAPDLEVVAVVTSTDKWGGRGNKTLLQSAVKKYAQSQNIPVLQPEKFRNPDFLEELRSYKADLQVVVAFKMLPKMVWDMPKLGSMNLHGSLLPKYRGAAPLNWAVINGEKETGLTTFLLQHEIDTGELLLQYKTPIGPAETVGELHDRLMIAGGDLVLRSVRLLKTGNYQTQPQVETEVCHAPKIFHQDCLINFQQPAQKVFDFIRGLSPYPVAWTKVGGKKLKIYRSQIIFAEQSASPGSIWTDGKKFLRIAAQGAWLDILELQAEKRKRMDVQTFLNGQEWNASAVDPLD